MCMRMVMWSPHMYAHGHLAIIQMATWVERGTDQIRARLALGGFAATVARFPVHCRWMGRPADSGHRRAIFTVQNQAAAELSYQVTWNWWAYVDEAIDPRGWRGVSQRWA